jgi:hypothetical protein
VDTFDQHNRLPVRKSQSLFPSSRTKPPSITTPSPAPFNSDAVYQPAEDTFLLLQAALAKARPEDLVLEIGCGSGFLSRVQETAAAAGLCAEVVASGRCFFEQLHVLRLKVESRA